MCQEQFKWTKQQCLEAYDPKGLQQKNAELEQKTGNNLEVITASYKISDPYDYSYDVAPAPTVHRVFSGCMKTKNGSLVAYDQQGSIIHDADKQLCKRTMNGDSPFNPYKQPEQVASYQFASAQPQTQEEQIQNPEVKQEPIPYGTKPPSNITGADSL